MTGRVRLDSRAADELDQAADWYERQRVGLGRDLVLEVGAAVRALARSPGGGSPVEGVDPTIDVRRVHVSRFPYQIVYVVHTEGVVVIAVAHDRRQPAYWESRADSP